MPARGSATIAWGGVAAQALLLAVAAPVSSAGLLTDPFALRLLSVFTSTNLLLIGLNLLPIPLLDGSRAWSAIPLWWRHWSRARREARHRVVTRQLEHLDRAAPPTDEAKVLAQKLLEDARRDLKN